MSKHKKAYNLKICLRNEIYRGMKAIEKERSEVTQENRFVFLELLLLYNNIHGRGFKAASEDGKEIIHKEVEILRRVVACARRGADCSRTFGACVHNRSFIIPAPLSQTCRSSTKLLTRPVFLPVIASLMNLRLFSQKFNDSKGCKDRKESDLSIKLISEIFTPRGNSKD